MSVVDRLVRVTPTPAAVAKLAVSHGMDAAKLRWWYVSDRELGELGRLGRIALGWDVPPSLKRRSSSPAQEDPAILASFALGELTAAEVAAGMPVNGLRMSFIRRGILDLPKISKELRSPATRNACLAARGDAEAAARIAAKRDHAAEVYRVCQAALALVPEQPPFGLPRLPEPSPELSAALAGFTPAAVSAVFPDLHLERTP